MLYRHGTSWLYQTDDGLSDRQFRVITGGTGWRLGLGSAQKMRKMRPWLLSDVNTVLSSGSLVHRQTRRLTGVDMKLQTNSVKCEVFERLGGGGRET